MSEFFSCLGEKNCPMSSPPLPLYNSVGSASCAGHDNTNHMWEQHLMHVLLNITVAIATYVCTPEVVV